MKITLYTITDCQFSKQEKEYLTSHKLTYEEKNLETNRDYLTEMLTLSNNFAGTPVTKIEKDDGQIVVLKGFTLEEFDKTLGFTAQPANPPPVQPVPQPVQQVNPQPVPQMPVSEPSPPVQVPVQSPVNEDMPAPVPPPAPAMAQTPNSPDTSNPMNSVLNNLQNQASAPSPLPNIPDPKL